MVEDGDKAALANLDDDQRARLVGVMQRIKHARVWEEAHLPMYRSLLGRDLLIHIAYLYLQGLPLHLKEIYLDLPYSENAIRLHLRRLEKDCWISMPRNGEDKRVRQVKPKRRLLNLIDRYFVVLQKNRDSSKLP